MKIQSLGHVVLKVTDLERSEKFYTGVLGMRLCARFNEQGMNMTFFSLGNHHDLALAQVSGEEQPAGEQAVGLHHVAFCVGSSHAELVEAKNRLESEGLELNPVDHGVTRSLYFNDPDGNTLEVYVDVSDAWRKDPQQVAQGRPLEI